jgi:hypothetical protein
MALNIRPPGDSPNWFTSFFNILSSVLNRADQQNVKYLRKDFTYTSTSVSLGNLPPNATIIAAMSGVEVHEVFNAGTTNTFAMGTAAATTLYGTGKPLGALGFVPLTAAVSYHPSDTAATEIKLTVTLTGVAATTGKGSAWVAYTLSQEG